MVQVGSEWKVQDPNFLRMHARGWGGQNQTLLVTDLLLKSNMSFPDFQHKIRTRHKSISVNCLYLLFCVNSYLWRAQFNPDCARPYLMLTTRNMHPVEGWWEDTSNSKAS